MVMPPRRKTNHTHKEKPMQEQTMTIENALQILANVTGAYRGTRDEHRTIEAALNAVVCALQQNQMGDPSTECPGDAEGNKRD